MYDIEANVQEVLRGLTEHVERVISEHGGIVSATLEIGPSENATPKENQTFFSTLQERISVVYPNSEFSILPNGWLKIVVHGSGLFMDVSDTSNLCESIAQQIEELILAGYNSTSFKLDKTIPYPPEDLSSFLFRRYGIHPLVSDFGDYISFTLNFEGRISRSSHMES